MGAKWKALYNVLQRRVTACDDNTAAFFNDDKSVLCSCCKIAFLPITDTGPFSELTALEWTKRAEQMNMCSACCSLSARRRSNVRAARHNIAQAKATAFQTRSPFTQTELDDRKQRKAAEVLELATSFCFEMKEIIPERHTYYLHALVWHFPTWIKDLDIDIMDFSGSGIEMLNQETKKIVKYVHNLCLLISVYFTRLSGITATTTRRVRDVNARESSSLALCKRCASCW